jgi:hypothetical protein
MANAELIDLDESRLSRYANAIGTAGATGPESGNGTDAETEQTAMLVFALDAINFGSGYHDIVIKRPGQSGAVTMSSALTEYANRTGPLTAERLRAISPVDCGRIFGQEMDGAAKELMNRFATALNDLGVFMAKGGDKAMAVIDAAEQSAVRLAEALTEMPFFRDVEELDGQQVSFYKRAQLTTADLSRRLSSSERCGFGDLHRLTAFADNLVPHVLRVDGVLQYNAELAAAIDAGERLDAGERAEVEIRAAAVHAVELLTERTGLRAMDLDEMLWLRGGGSRYKAIPRHRARSVFY